MPKRKHDIAVNLIWNDSGAPVVSISPEAKITLSVDQCESNRTVDPSLPPQKRSVAIHGNRAGLIALAEQILAVAHTDIEGFHQHFDNECPADFVDADGDWELIIGRNDSRAIRNALADG